MRWFYRTLYMEDLWHKEAKRNTHRSRNGRHRRLREVTKNVASAAKKRNAAHARQQTNQIRAVARKAGEVVARSGANRARAKVGEKAAGNKLLISAKNIASGQRNTRTDVYG